MGWPHREVQPDGSISVLFYQQFVKILIRFLRVVDKNGRVTDGLFHPRRSDIHRTPRQVI